VGGRTIASQSPDAVGGIVVRRTLSYWAQRSLGGYSPLVRWYRGLRPRWWWLRAHRLGKATRRFVDECGLTVRGGPFAGMTYPQAAVARVSYLPAKLLGAYESEIGSFLGAADGFDLFVDVGSADGYYCVGMALRHPEVQVIGYETDRFQRAICRQLIDANGVSLDIRGTASHEALNELPVGRMLLLCDVEGYEYELMDPERIPRLRTATMIVEVHPWVRENLVGVVADRFEGSHEINVIKGTPRYAGAYSELADWSPDLASMAITEGRSDPAVWLILMPRAVGPGDAVT
jgi:hypothetical protein